MDENATGEATHHEFERGGENPQQTRYITWPEQEAGKNKSLILQPVTGNSKSRKTKGKAETRRGVKVRSTNLTALKMIARQGADEKSQLEEWKAGLMNDRATEISQLHKMHEEAMEDNARRWKNNANISCWRSRCWKTKSSS